MADTLEQLIRKGQNRVCQQVSELLVIEVPTNEIVVSFLATKDEIVKALRTRETGAPVDGHHVGQDAVARAGFLAVAQQLDNARRVQRARHQYALRAAAVGPLLQPGAQEHWPSSVKAMLILDVDFQPKIEPPSKGRFIKLTFSDSLILRGIKFL